LHLRLATSFAIGLFVFLALYAFGLPPKGGVPQQLLIAWNVFVGLYLVLTAVLMARSDVGRLRQRAAEDDEGAVALMLLAALAALASLGAIFFELASADRNNLLPHVALAILTIALSWIFIHAMFAQHYAHEYYGETGETGGGLKFPGAGGPGYWDFLYFSLVIGMTSQVSDVSVTSKATRITVAAHGVFAFAFNTAIIALTVNMVVGLR
jgi:uncharacterized membrane protein